MKKELVVKVTDQMSIELAHCVAKGLHHFSKGAYIRLTNEVENQSILVLLVVWAAYGIKHFFFRPATVSCKCGHPIEGEMLAHGWNTCAWCASEAEYSEEYDDEVEEFNTLQSVEEFIAEQKQETEDKNAWLKELAADESFGKRYVVTATCDHGDDMWRDLNLYGAMLKIGELEMVKNIDGGPYWGRFIVRDTNGCLTKCLTQVDDQPEWEDPSF